MLQAQVTDSDLISYPHYFLFYYIAREYGPDWYSWSLINFKKDERNDVPAWIDYTIIALKKLELDKDTVLIRALHSHETSVTRLANTPLDRLCRALSATYDCRYRPGLICKARATAPLHKQQSIDGRVAELTGVYQFNTAKKIRCKSILLVDDLLTSGLTAKYIIDAVKAAMPHVNITVFSLAKTSFNPDVNQKLHLQGAKHTWNGILWMKNPNSFP